MRFLIAILLLAPGLVAEEEQTKPASPGEIAIPDPGTAIEDPAVAKQEVARFVERMKEAGDDEKAVELLTRLGAWDHPQVLSAASKYVRDKREKVAVAAVIACARQSTSKQKAGSILAKSLNREKRTPVTCALIVGMGRLSYDKKTVHKVIVKVFRKDTSETHKAAARYFGYIRDKKAFRMLAERLDEPKNTLPPQGRKKLPIPSEAEKRRKWEEWKSAFPSIQWAMSQIVPGETFESRGEAREWALTEGKEHGISWE
ncbi:MAG: hypothetical protein ACYTGV_13475 [Planctomycetota bacterium]|jgi:ATP-dependent helicase YprA (DUF1998 family)